ncbi:HD domain-containing phosphohydrolase [Streptomyces sp. ME19-01-6]|uniref:HD domain-containing phosphohydrolase n=1 Tax=Streptomyces sp. ME19-01-6 TaxID=3028686 RepID=UPI0029A516A8|nr:HD domain-containing protein [Streptomyces sp. ME19-01-6]
MRAVPLAARVYVLSAALLAAVCAAPALRPTADIRWATAALLAALYAAGARRPPSLFFQGSVRLRGASDPVDGRPRGGSTSASPARAAAPLRLSPSYRWEVPPRPAASPDWCGPVLLAGVFLLPAPAAALVAVPGALLGPVERRPAGVRRLWRAARLALAAYAASLAFGLCGGREALAAPAGGPGFFPYALVPAAAAALVLGLTAAALEGGVLITAEGRPPRAAWRGRVLCSLVPHLVHGLAGLTMAVLWRSPYGPLAALLVLPPMYVCARAFALYHQERAAHQATVRALVQAVDIKDRYTRGHSERVGRASVMIARELGMSGDRLEALRVAGVLHDVGKLGVPTRLLRKNGPLTPEERRVIELHPEYGHEMVRGIGFLGEAREAVLHHHERLDGSGYPHGLAGADIPEAARVVAVADAFDAMTSTRTYRRARPVPAAVAELKRCAGAQFDPRMVGALARALDRYGWPAAVPEEARPLAPAVPPGPAAGGAPAVPGTPAVPGAPAASAVLVVPAAPAAAAALADSAGRDHVLGRTPARTLDHVPDRDPSRAPDQRGNVPPAPGSARPPEAAPVPDGVPGTGSEAVPGAVPQPGPDGTRPQGLGLSASGPGRGGGA